MKNRWKNSILVKLIIAWNIENVVESVSPISENRAIIVKQKYLLSSQSKVRHIGKCLRHLIDWKSWDIKEKRWSTKNGQKKKKWVNGMLWIENPVLSNRSMANIFRRWRRFIKNLWAGYIRRHTKWFDRRTWRYILEVKETKPMTSNRQKGRHPVYLRDLSSRRWRKSSSMVQEVNKKKEFEMRTWSRIIFFVINCEVTQSERMY